MLNMDSLVLFFTHNVGYINWNSQLWFPQYKFIMFVHLGILAYRLRVWTEELGLNPGPWTCYTSILPLTTSPALELNILIYLFIGGIRVWTQVLGFASSNSILIELITSWVIWDKLLNLSRFLNYNMWVIELLCRTVLYLKLLNICKKLIILPGM
jgi:hypothetical protein